MIALIADSLEVDPRNKGTSTEFRVIVILPYILLASSRSWRAPSR